MKILMDDKAINRAITRIAHEIIENNKGVQDLVILGIKTRGVPLAKCIIKKIKLIENVDVPLGILDITFYRDDLNHKSIHPILNNKLNVDVKNKTVILVDDVVFTGRTCRAALDAVMAAGRARKVQFVALVDRGHRELPLTPDYVGKNLPTSKNEVVHVRLVETDGEDIVVITN
ncbi:MAG: bifunctional pyr operon transcriptional regulator/uracil phosphoribosyltransferase PyrR [Firmicutes bacterium HGW-Firmicutes-7]|nr:MAG: bifunctional pyr operon transcriptional regulator/uracil phosphoribosyltransferase PyrR [Firmicutes bacterium HGW-Firmicutes-7]